MKYTDDTELVADTVIKMRDILDRMVKETARRHEVWSSVREKD